MVVHGNGVVPLLAIMYINYAIAWMCGSVRFLGPALCWMFNIGLLALRGLGVDPATALQVINSSSGRSLQTERLPDNVLSRKFAVSSARPLQPSPFALPLKYQRSNACGASTASHLS